MSYCRFSKEHDVYLYNNGQKYIFNIANNISAPRAGDIYSVDTPQLALAELNILRQEGYRLDNNAIERLEREIKEG